MIFKIRAILIFFLACSSIAHAQLDSLAMLDSLSGVESNLGEKEQKKDDPEEKTKDNSAKEREDLKDDQYGYTGGKNFNNPPKTKFSVNLFKPV